MTMIIGRFPDGRPSNNCPIAEQAATGKAIMSAVIWDYAYFGKKVFLNQSVRDGRGKIDMRHDDHFAKCEAAEEPPKLLTPLAFTPILI